MELIDILRQAVSVHASDIVIISGLPVTYKLKGQLHRVGESMLFPPDIQTYIKDIYALANDRSFETLEKRGEDDFSLSVEQLARFRVNAFRQRGSLAMVIRIVSFTLPDYKELSIPENVMSFAESKKGLVLVSGPADSGKSTTLACIIDAINTKANRHIITIEDPIEYLHRHKKSVVTQRELSMDTLNYDSALRAALRQAPDVLLLGEMRDHETMKSVITTAETGHLVLSTLHTVGAANTIERVIDSFPSSQQNQIRTQLSMVLVGVISQQLIPAIEGGVRPAFEIMRNNTAIANMIREGKGHQIEGIIYSSSGEGMVTMDTSLFHLVKNKIVTPEDALAHSLNREQLERRFAMGQLM